MELKSDDNQFECTCILYLKNFYSDAISEIGFVSVLAWGRIKHLERGSFFPTPISRFSFYHWQGVSWLQMRETNRYVKREGANILIKPQIGFWIIQYSSRL